ncbi:MAG: right-handed parallel beta-helix repeat-containing protein, partial [Alphaproteobacteria bacterium]|nr:right-handed parallel beta-helix repeat-containing protein [Alphaproteobacteria bacterium]
MNKAITDGIVFMPQPFAIGLDQWSREDGRPGSDTYANAADSAFVPADQDFGGALELQKTQSVQRLRYMGETPILPGCYLQIRVRIKAIAGNLPSVRIAAFAGGAGGVALSGVTVTGPQVALTTYGDVVEVTAIVGTGTRTGVDMAWGRAAIFGHFGLDLTGPSGGVVRIDDIVIEDVSRFFLRDVISTVDVRDYGALGNGVADDHAAFEAADTAAEGREIIVPAGQYVLGQSTTIQSRIRFEGTVEMPDAAILALTKNFDLPAYIDAFGDSELAFKKAYQALLNNPDHVTLDLAGRKVSLRAPVDMAAAVVNRTTYNQRHVIQNGQISVFPGPAWETEVMTSQASYDIANSKRLTNVTNVANIPVGALIEGNGVGREVYVTAKNVAAQRLDISQPLFDAAGTQVYTFRRFKYLLDFSGFEDVSRMVVSEVDFQCTGDCSGVLLPPQGSANHFRDCFF